MSRPFDVSTPFQRFSSNGAEQVSSNAASTTAGSGAFNCPHQLSTRRKRANEIDDDILALIGAMRNYIEEEDGNPESSDDVNTRPKEKRSRKSREGLARWTNPDGTFIRLIPSNSYWYKSYVEYPGRDDPHFLKKFRLRFRLPYPQFEELAESLEHVDCFKRWHHNTVNMSRVRSAPIPLLVLTSLRYLGRGLTFDDLEEATWCNADVIRVFFHKFVKYGSTVLYDKYIRSPVTHDDSLQHTGEYKLAGFPGAVGSTDATHILIERLQARFRQTHIGFKMTHTARTYNVTVNHRRRILSTTKGHPARWNDKTLATFDDFMQKINNGTILNDSLFELYDFDNEGVVIKRTYCGAWLLVDNGYLSWATTVPPIKTTIKKSKIRFSAWLESMRKDVECTFGILKGRWRILKSGIRLSGVECADNIFLTCCALHNWLLEVDGLDKEWRNGVLSDWEGAIGEVPGEVSSTNGRAGGAPVGDDAATTSTTMMGGDGAVLPDAIYRLHHPVSQRANLVDHEPPPVAHHELEEAEEPAYRNEEGISVPRTVGGVHVVRNLSLPFFRSKLVRHFDIAFKRNEVQWPRRLARTEPPASNL